MDSASLWERRLQQDTRRLVILDDDPTGTQTVAGVEVILRPELGAYRRFFAGGSRAVYVLTNSRALVRAEAVELLGKIRREVEQAAQEAGERVAFLLRGDSTLRGHVFAEMDVLAQGYPDSVLLFVPAFPEGGRLTVGGVHYLVTGEERVPVAQTEFARDSVFGYRSERIVDWVAEVGGRRKAISLPLEQIRDEGAAAVTRALLAAEAGTVIVPDAETRGDLELVAAGLLDAEAQGRHVVVRSASTFASVRSGLRGGLVEPMVGKSEPRVLVVCGSHTEASTRQLQALVERSYEAHIIPTEQLLQEGVEAVLSALAQQIRSQLNEQRFAILATERVRLPQHQDLGLGAQVMAAVTAIVAQVAECCDAVIAKGGITSAQVATDGLGATRAWVQGQLEAGVSLWTLTLPDERLLPYAVVPGNVGTDRTLARIAAQFRVAPLLQLKEDL